MILNMVIKSSHSIISVVGNNSLLERAIANTSQKSFKLLTLLKTGR